MGRTKRSARLGSRESRLKLAPIKRHQEPLSDGRYLLYRKPKNGAAGVWMAGRSHLKSKGPKDEGGVVVGHDEAAS
jgi:hypothetical protein